MTLEERTIIADACGVPVGWFTAPLHLLGAAQDDADLDAVDAIDAVGEAMTEVRADVKRLLALTATDAARAATNSSQMGAPRRRHAPSARDITQA